MLLAWLRRPCSAAVEHAENLDGVIADPIHQQVRGPRYCHFARSWNSAPATDAGGLAQQRGNLENPRGESGCCGGVVLGDVVSSVFEVAESRVCPNEIHRGRWLSASLPQDSSH